MSPTVPVVPRIRYWLACILYFGGLGIALVALVSRAYVVLFRADRAGVQFQESWDLSLTWAFVLILGLGAAAVGAMLDSERKLLGRRRRGE